MKLYSIKLNTIKFNTKNKNTIINKNEDKQTDCFYKKNVVDKSSPTTFIKPYKLKALYLSHRSLLSP